MKLFYKHPEIAEQISMIAQILQLCSEVSAGAVGAVGAVWTRYEVRYSSTICTTM